MTSQNEIDGIVADQPLLFARMLEAIGQMGEIQKLVARTVIELQMRPDLKVVVSGNLANAINSLNRASHLIMHASIKNGEAVKDEEGGAGHH
jgi:hypothetical protein